MIDGLLGALSIYSQFLLIATTISLGSLSLLKVGKIRSYTSRTTLLMLPMIGALMLELWQGIPCIVHQLSTGVDYIAHLLCAQSLLQLTCILWSAGIGISLVAMGITLGIQSTLGYVIIEKKFGGNPITEEAGDLHTRVNELSRKAAVVPPKLFLIESSKSHIFSTGHGERASIFLSVGLLESLSEDEVAAVLAHEIAHCKNNDSGLKILAGRLKYLLFNPLGFLLEPIISREQEFFADDEASKLVGSPSGLISAMEKLSSSISYGDISVKENSLPNFNGLKWRLFQRHPRVSERINRLQRIT